jgi:hypothetical protein
MSRRRSSVVPSNPVACRATRRASPCMSVRDVRICDLPEFSPACNGRCVSPIGGPA